MVVFNAGNVGKVTYVLEDDGEGFGSKDTSAGLESIEADARFGSLGYEGVDLAI
jgi:hypothetical protein